MIRNLLNISTETIRNAWDDTACRIISLALVFIAGPIYFLAYVAGVLAK